MQVDMFERLTPGITNLRDNGVSVEGALRLVDGAIPDVEQIVRDIYEAPPHPKKVPIGLGLVAVAARTYFGYRLMIGGDIKRLKRDPYWRYMEGDR